MTKLVMFKTAGDRTVVINPEYVVLLRDGRVMRGGRYISTDIVMRGQDEPIAVEGDVADVAKRLIHD